MILFYANTFDFTIEVLFENAEHVENNANLINIIILFVYHTNN